MGKRESLDGFGECARLDGTRNHPSCYSRCSTFVRHTVLDGLECETNACIIKEALAENQDPLRTNQESHQAHQKLQGAISLIEHSPQDVRNAALETKRPLIHGTIAHLSGDREAIRAPLLQVALIAHTERSSNREPRLADETQACQWRNVSICQYITDVSQCF